MKGCPKPKKLTILNKFFSNTVIGGTFDRLHIGHKGLISLSLEISEKAHICIMSQKWVMEKVLSDKIEHFDKRKRKIEEFLDKISLRQKAIISEIHDPYSYALTSKYANILDSIVVSNEDIVVKRTIEINEMREERDLKPLKIIKMPLVLDYWGKPYSSTRIREGKLKIVEVEKYIKMLEKARRILKEPKGEVFDSVDDLPKPKDCIISIGDIVTESLIRAGYPISIAIIDRKSRRNVYHKYFFKISEEKDIITTPIIIPSLNPSGRLTSSAWYTTSIALSQEEPVVMRVYGEEDLYGFPATILAPEGAMIYYGDPFLNKIVLIEVDSETKERAKRDLKRAFAI